MKILTQNLLTSYRARIWWFSRVKTQCVGACCCFSPVWLFVTPWALAHQAPLSMGFSRQEYWSGLPCPFPGDLPDPQIEPASLMSPALVGSFFTPSATRKAPSSKEIIYLKSCWAAEGAQSGSLSYPGGYRGREGGWGGRGCALSYGWFVLYGSNKHNIVDKLFLNFKKWTPTLAQLKISLSCS